MQYPVPALLSRARSHELPSIRVRQRVLPLALSALALILATAGRCESPVAALPAPYRRAISGIDGKNPWQYIVIHHSATTGGNTALFDGMHRKKGWSGVAYHFVITNGKGGADGALQISPRWKAQKHGAHAGRSHGAIYPDERNAYNEFGIGICLVGNFQERPPTTRQLKTLVGLVAYLKKQFEIPDECVVGHGHVTTTACPGKHFPWGRLFALIKSPPPTHLGPQAPVLTTELCQWCLERDEPSAVVVRDNPNGNDASIPPPIRLYNGQ